MADDSGGIQFLRPVFQELEPDLRRYSSDLSAGYHHVSALPEAYCRRSDGRRGEGLISACVGNPEEVSRKTRMFYTDLMYVSGKERQEDPRRKNKKSQFEADSIKKERTYRKARLYTSAFLNKVINFTLQ